MRMYFACGAWVEVDSNIPLPKSRVFVFVNDDNETMRGRLKTTEGVRVHCLLNCPSTVRQSGRKKVFGWFGKNADKPSGKPTWAVQCRPVRMEEVVP